MAETQTLNYQWTMPDPGGSANTWGATLNATTQKIDAALWDINANSATFAGAVTVNGALTLASLTATGGASFGGALTVNGFTNLSGYTVSQASGSGNAYFVLNDNAGTGMGYLYWDPGNQVVLANQTGGGNLILNPDGSASVSGLLTTQGLNTTLISCSGLACSGNASISGQLNILGAVVSNSYLAGTGLANRPGTGGASSSAHQYNFWWDGSHNTLWLDGSNWGQIQTNSDYRMKKDVEPLGSMWGTVKALNPVSYTHKDWTPAGSTNGAAVAGDNVERWGFIAHELQETLVDSAATGVKDDPVHVQSPNPFTVIAALTKALQEAMTRIEALEAAR